MNQPREAPPVKKDGLDSCVWGGARKTLEDAGHDVVWSGDWKQDPGDSEILEIAHREGRILVTLDKDFGELVLVYRIPPAQRERSHEEEIDDAPAHSGRYRHLTEQTITRKSMND